jgi:hypothetical protein
MDNRVNIHYSIDIADLPQEVERLLGNAQTEIKAFKKLTGAWNKDLLTLATLEQIGDIRTTMSRLDHMLHDITEIINGYVSYKTTPDSSEQQPNPENLQHDLARLSQIIQGGENEEPPPR